MDYTWHPKKDTGFTGYVILSIPSWTEQLNLAAEQRSDLDADGNIAPDKQAEFMSKKFELVSKHVKKVSMRAGKGVSMSSIDELFVYSEGKKFFLELYNIIIDGPSALGNG